MKILPIRDDKVSRALEHAIQDQYGENFEVVITSVRVSDDRLTSIEGNFIVARIPVGKT